MITVSMIMRFVVSTMIVVTCPFIGMEILGRPGVFVGLILGLALSWFAWRFLTKLDGKMMVRSAKSEFSDKSVEELRELLRVGNTMTPNLIILALMLRGENIDRDIYPILDYLESKSTQSRILGYAALRTGYPYFTQIINDYGPTHSFDVCRAQVVKLRLWIDEQLQKVPT